MSTYPGILTISSSCSELYVTKTGSGDFAWDGTDIGSVDDIANHVSCTANVRLYYCVSGFYFILEKYTELNHHIEILKDIFEIPRKPYHLCTHRSKPYLMFLSYPDFELPIKRPVTKMDDFERVILVFHWIICVTGKFWRYDGPDGSVVFSRGPYTLDYEKSDLKDSIARRIFRNITIKKELSEFFVSDEKKEQLRSHFSELHTWYNEIINRLSILECIDESI